MPLLVSLMMITCRLRTPVRVYHLNNGIGICNKYLNQADIVTDGDYDSLSAKL